MRTRSCFNLIAVLVLLTLVAGCGPSGKPAAAPAGQIAPTNIPAAPTSAAAAQPSPTPLPLPTATRAPLPPMVIGVMPARGEEAMLAAPVVITFDQPMDPAATGRRVQHRAEGAKAKSRFRAMRSPSHLPNGCNAGRSTGCR